MRKNTVLSVLILFLVLVAGIGSYIFVSIQQEQVESFIAKRQKEMQSDSSILLQDGLVGRTYVTAALPTDNQGQVIEVVQQVIYQQVDQRVKRAKPDKKIERLLFVAAEKKASDIPLVDSVRVTEEEYRIKGLKRQQIRHTTVGQFRLTADGQVFQFPHLFTDFEATKPQLLEVLKAEWQAAGRTDEGLLVIKMAGFNWEMADFSYASGQLTISLPEEVGGVKEFKLPLQNVFATLHRHYIPDEDLPAYDQYQLEVARKDMKLVALTFDDGPNPETTPRVLELLKKYRAKGTFFVLGQKIEGNEGILKQMVAEGHEIGNHTFTHPNLVEMSDDVILSEINQTQDAIQAALGQKPTIYRPPYGSADARVANLVNLPAIHWSVDTLDWENRDPHQIVEQVKANMAPGGIVLMHDIHPETVDALEPMLEYLVSQGYVFVTTTELLGANLDPKAMYFDQHSSQILE